MPDFIQEIFRTYDQGTLIWLVVIVTIVISSVLMLLFDVVTPDEGDE